MINKVLVANRGEIAVRIMRSCREMGIKTVAVYSDADRNSQHVRYATEAYHIGASPSNQSYLNIERIIETALKSGADAIHPGYGFLSENAQFAQQVEEAGIIFIGPSYEAISSMGDKLKARKIMMDANVKVVPGTEANHGNDQQLLREAEKIGYPIMVKASAGGGGKGMRLVKQKSELITAYKMAQSEARRAFGNDTIYLEKYIESPHHIEFQILGDTHGNIIHLFERECSVQRRHQKVVEETPSPLMTPELQAKMGEQAIAAAKSVNYVGAGTIEFLVDNNQNFYFLEMNTRLQVEHPITERVTGVDLVKAQINIANGLPLEYKQEDLTQNGHAIECRIYAEDPFNNFMPNPGKVKHISEPLGLGVRTDGYVYEGYEIPMEYDPMISKLIVWAHTRQEAIQRMKRALFEYKITGVKTSIPYLENIMSTPNFVDGNYDTNFIEKNTEYLSKKYDCVDECEEIALFIAYLDYTEKLKKRSVSHSISATNNNSWKEFAKRKSIIRL